VLGEPTQEHDRITVFVQSLARWWVARLVLVFVLGSLGCLNLRLRLVHGKVRLSKNPLEGVVVTPAWYKAYSRGGWGGAGYYDSEETVRDINGRFIIQSKPTWTINPFSSIKGPEFYIFKSGYGQWQFQGQDQWSKDALESEDNESSMAEVPPGRCNSGVAQADFS
jgi:hypothetical protein